MTEDSFISLTFRSHITPTLDMEEFRLGKSYQVSMERGTTLLEFADKLFSQNKKQIRFITVNGQMAESSRVLAQGDLVHVYGLYSGG